MKSKVFSLVILWVSVTIVVMFAFHYPLINRSEFEGAVSQINSENKNIINDLSYEVNRFKLAIEAFSYTLDSGKKWLDEASSFLKNNESILEAHQYDENRLKTASLGRSNRQISLEIENLEGMFFYQTMILEQYNNETYLIYYKGEKNYLVLLVDFNKLLSPYLNESRNFVGVYDQHIVPLLESGESLNARMYFDDAASRNVSTGYFEETFYSIESFDVENITLSVLTVVLDQSFKRAMRLYFIRMNIISIVLLAIGFLVAWRVVKVFRHALLTENMSQLGEVKSIKKNITQAIRHMDMASKSFDDINLLKEELEMLYEDLDEGVEHNEELVTKEEHK